MTATPTPEEARRALRDIDDRQQQTVAAGASPRWWWIGSGILVAGYGVLVDLEPGFVHPWGDAFIWVFLALAIARNSRWGAPFFGRQLRPRLALSGARRYTVAAIGTVVVLALTVGALWLDVPHMSAWFGLGGGLLLILAGPWWENHVLERNARR